MTIERGELLFRQSRYDLAEAELRQALGAEPGDAYAHALLALTLIERKQLDEATTEAQQAIHLSPAFPFAHYALAKVWYERDHYDKARTAIEEAIRLDPHDADYRFILAAIHFDERRWQDALRVAEEGLALDPEHSACTNMRAMALVKLGRNKEAGATIDAALAREPENAATHANQGWALLEQGKPAKALEHFRESLRLNPENEWARTGIVQALKAHNPVYAVMLRYFLWMSKLTRRTQWIVIIAGYMGNRMLAQVASSNPELAPWLLPLRILYVAFVLLTWIADPLFNLVLRLNRFGRLALSREQIVESNWIGATILLAVLSLLGYFVVRDERLLVSAMVFGLLIIPVAGTLKLPVQNGRNGMSVYTALLALIGVGSLLTGTTTAEKGAEPNWALFGLFVLGVIASAWATNIMIMRRPRR